MSNVNLKQKTIGSMKWRAISQVVQACLSFVTFAVLARLLGPEVFGLFALAFIVIDGLAMFKGLGIDSALVRRRDRIEDAANTAFLIVPLFGVFIFSLLFAIAPYAASFFEEEQLKPVIWILGIGFLLNSFSFTHCALLVRELGFKKRSLITIAGSITNSVLAITCAFLGLGIWSLVIGYVAKQFVISTSTFLAVPFRPNFKFDFKIAKELIHFGKYVLAKGFVAYAIVNFDRSFIGKMMSSESLGYYSIALALAGLLTKYINDITSRVMFPAYSKVQDDFKLLRSVFMKGTKFCALLAIPFAGGLFALAPEFIGVVYGNLWMPVVPILRVMVLVAFIAPFFMSGFPLLLAVGRPKELFKVNISTLIALIVLTLLLTPTFGLMGVAAAFTLSRFTKHTMTGRSLSKYVGIRFGELFWESRKIIINTMVMVGSLFLLKPYVAFEEPGVILKVAELGMLGLFGITLYGVATYFTERGLFLEIISTLQNKNKHGKARNHLMTERATKVNPNDTRKGPKVSVIIPVYNGARFVASSIQSALDQSYRDFEVIVVDDGSTDDTRSVVEKFGDQVRYVYQSNKGLSAARNTGMRSSTAEYMAFLDADDLWDSHKLEAQLRVLEREPEVAWIGSYLEPMDESGKRLGGLKPMNEPAKDFDSMYIFGTAAPSSVVVRSSCLNKSGLFDEMITGMEDLDFFMRLSRHYPFRFLGEVLGAYRKWSGSLSQSQKKKMWQGYIKIGNWTLLQKELGSEARPRVKKRLAKYYYNLSKESYLSKSYYQGLQYILKGIWRSPQVGTYFFTERDSALNKMAKTTKPYLLLAANVLLLPFSRKGGEF